MVVVTCSAVVTGCMVGPNFNPPEAPNSQTYTSTAIPAKTVAATTVAGKAQTFKPGEKIPHQWWMLFHSEPLDRLIRQAMTDNPTTAAAQAALREAEENLRAQSGASTLPAVNAKLAATRERFSGSSFGQSGGATSTFTLYNASVNVSYLLDISGGVKRELEALRAQVDYQRFELQGTYLALTANIVTSAIQEASLRAQLQATREILADQQQQYKMIQEQFKLGGNSRTDVLAQQTQLAKTQASLPPLEKALSQARHRLAVLVGKLPGDAGGLPEFEIHQMVLPEDLPLSLPSSLVRQRPDIQAAEALLHAASAQVGVATANLYPQITLTGSYGSESNKIGDLFQGDTIVWNFGAGLLQPIFQGGALKAKKRAAVAAYDQASALYRETVLQAFLNVADVLQALTSDADTLKAQSDVEAAAADTLALTKKQFQFGAISYLSLLDAERQYQQARISLIQAQAARFADTAALFQALGGGWQAGPAEGAASK